MAGVTTSAAANSAELRGPAIRQLLAAIAELRWRLFVNSMRTIRGRLEAVSRLFAVFTMSMLAFGGAAGLAILAYMAVERGRFVYLTLLFWSVFVFWQLYPVLGSAFAAPFEFSNILRFPVSFSSFYALNVAFGLFDPVAAVCLFWLVGIFVGIGIARASLLPWAFVILLLFGVMNVLLSRAVYVWLERWLAKRRTREVLGVAFLFLMISAQLIGPAITRERKHDSPMLKHAAIVARVADFFPPGLAKQALVDVRDGSAGYALLSIASLGVYTLGVAALLGTRLHAQFTGENISETLAPLAVAQTEPVREGWNMPLLPAPVAAIFEKEIRYLLRSAPMIFTFIMPLFILVLFRFTPQRGAGGSSFLVKAPDWAFPIGAAYAMLILTNIVYNSFGADGCGLQVYLTAPVKFRDVFLAKNLAHTNVLGVAILSVLVATFALYRPPSLAITFATFTGLLFAWPVNLAAGNLMSIYSPKKFDFGGFNRQRASGATALVSMGVELVVIGIALGVLFFARYLHRVWLAGLIFLPLAAIAFVAYWIILNLAARRALEKREVLMAEICRT